MPTYTYSCPHCGPFSLFRPMAQSGHPAPCPGCERASRRVFDAPHVGALDPALERAVTHAERSAETPQVTRRIPPALRSNPPRRAAHPGPAGHSPRG